MKGFGQRIWKRCDGSHGVKRTLAALLCMLMIISLMPIAALAQAPTETPTLPEVTATPEAKTPLPVESPVVTPPVTEPPVTEPPVTEPPVTESPVTEPPVTEPPVTEPVKECTCEPKPGEGAAHQEGCPLYVAPEVTPTPAAQDDKNIVSFSKPEKIEKTIGTAESALELPATLTATLKNGDTMTVQVTWTADAPYDANTAGEYIFNAAIDLPEGYSYDGELPTIVVFINGYAPIKAFTETNITLEVERGTTVEEVIKQLPQKLTAVDINGRETEVDVIWTAPENDLSRIYEEDAYSIESAFTYGPWVFKAELTDEYLYDGEMPTANVTIPDCSEISQNYLGYLSDGPYLRYIIHVGGSVELSRCVDVRMADGGYKQFPIKWSGSYDANTPGIYTLGMNVGGISTTAEIVVRDFQRGN